MSYEGAFLTAVAGAYFLALNALAAYLFLRLVQVQEEARSLRERVDRISPGWRRPWASATSPSRPKG